MTAWRRPAGAVLRFLGVAVLLVVLIVGTPVAGLLGVAAWQQYAPASLRAVVLQAAAVTEADGVDEVVDNLRAALEPDVRPRG